jgi:acyl dehydratase
MHHKGVDADMAEMNDHHGLYYEDIDLDAQWVSPTRCITQHDVLEFAEMTGDFNPLHVDPEYARRTPFKRPIAHGLLGLSLMAGLGSDSPAVRTTAFVRIIDWRFVRPIFPGDTITIHTRVVRKEPSGRRHGRVVWHRQIVNQHGEVVQDGELETLVMLRVAHTSELARLVKPR